MTAPVGKMVARKARAISPVWHWRALQRSFTRNTALHEPRLIHRDANLAVAWSPGKSNRMVLVFSSGYGKPWHPDSLEFRGCASDNGNNHVLFINDRRNSWYSDPKLRDRIVQVVSRTAAANGIQSMWSIGNSIGGYGAILFCDRLPISHAIAFAPQILMTDAVINGPIWARNRPGIQDTVVRDLTTILGQADATFWLLYGDQDEDDRIHLGHLRSRLPERHNLHIAIAKGQKHEIALWLKKQGRLVRLVNAAWTDDWQDLQTCAAILNPPLDLSLAAIGKVAGNDARNDHDQV